MGFGNYAPRFQQEYTLLKIEAEADVEPIVAPTYLLLYGQYASPAKADALKQFLKWALTEGGRSAADLGYAPLPTTVSAQVIKVVNRINVK